MRAWPKLRFLCNVLRVFRATKFHMHLSTYVRTHLQRTPHPSTPRTYHLATGPLRAFSGPTIWVLEGLGTAPIRMPSCQARGARSGDRYHVPVAHRRQRADCKPGGSWAPKIRTKPRCWGFVCGLKLKVAKLRVQSSDFGLF